MYNTMGQSAWWHMPPGCSLLGISVLSNGASGHRILGAYWKPKQCFLGAQLGTTGSLHEKNGRLPLRFLTEGCLQMWGLIGVVLLWRGIGISKYPFFAPFILFLKGLLVFSIQSPHLWRGDADSYHRGAVRVNLCWQSILKCLIEKRCQRWKLNKYLDR